MDYEFKYMNEFQTVGDAICKWCQWENLCRKQCNTVKAAVSWVNKQESAD